MNRETTLHIKLDRDMDAQLERLAQSRRKSKGQLAREAISACYQISMAELPLQQSRALAAYQGGYISLGKLAQAMGLHVLDLRIWLDERGIAQQNAYGDQDADRACIAWRSVPPRGLVVTDDRAARNCCSERGVDFTGTIGILKACCREGI